MMTDTRWRWPVILGLLDTLELAGYKRSDDDARTGRAIGLLWAAARIYAGEFDQLEAVPPLPLDVRDLAAAEADRRAGQPADGKTPGQVAWEAFCKSTGFLPPLSRWESKPASIRAAWEAAAQAACDHIDAAAGAAGVRDGGELRALVAEILGVFDPSKGDGYRARVGQVQIAKWRQRAGLEG